jgi:release factor glutamine methyltransferase
MNIGQLLELATRRLAAQPEARREVEILLGHALEVKRSFLYANRAMHVPRQRQVQFQQLLRRRVQGMPIAYLTGIRSFWSLDLRVTPAVLIPRPETELLVEKALELIPADAQQRLADLGTGSGAIALALAQERPHCEIHATDYSLDALQVARDNARRHQLGQVQFHHGSWTSPLSGRFDLILSNPPYIAQADPHLQQGDCRFEPRLALTPGADGLSALRQIAAEAHELLVAGGWLLLEHGYDQGAAVRAILDAAAYSAIATYRDLAGIERICVGRKQPPTISL